MNDPLTALAEALRKAIHDTLYHNMDPKAGFRWYWQTDDGTPNDLTDAVIARLSGYTLVPAERLARLERIEAAAPDLLALAVTANEGDPWFAQAAGMDADSIVETARAALSESEAFPAHDNGCPGNHEGLCPVPQR